MSLKIKQNNDTFFIQGRITCVTAKQFQKHMEFLIAYTKALTVDISNVLEIDANGMKALRTVYSYALHKGKRITFVGYGCKELYEDFESFEAA